jgi:hypothetical protein
MSAEFDNPAGSFESQLFGKGGRITLDGQVIIARSAIAHKIADRTTDDVDSALMRENICIKRKYHNIMKFK